MGLVGPQGGGIDPNRLSRAGDRLDPDYLRTEIRQQQGSERARYDTTQIEDPDASQW
jgi:hypothetical protein